MVLGIMSSSLVENSKDLFDLGLGVGGATTASGMKDLKPSGGVTFLGETSVGIGTVSENTDGAATESGYTTSSTPTVLSRSSLLLMLSRLTASSAVAT